jgi:hypothetical protein
MVPMTFELQLAEELVCLCRAKISNWGLGLFVDSTDTFDSSGLKEIETTFVRLTSFPKGCRYVTWRRHLRTR